MKRVYLMSVDSLLRHLQKKLYMYGLILLVWSGCSGEEVLPEAALFVGTTPSGIFKTRDFGQTWLDRNQGIPEDVRLIKAILPWKDDLLLVSFGGGIFRSTNNGGSWQAQNQGLSGDAQSAYAIAAVDSQLFVATLGGVFTSTDDGTSWEARNQGLTDDALVVRTIYADGNTLWIGTLAGIYRSTDLGQSWELSREGLWGKAFLRSENRLWFVSFEEGVHALEDQDSVWQAQHAGLTQPKSLKGLSVYGDGNQLYYGAEGGLYLFDPQELRWEQNVFSEAGAAQEVHAITRFQENLVLGTGEGLFFSEDEGQRWTRSSLQLPGNTLIVSFYVD